jgi:hypothetical protein
MAQAERKMSENQRISYRHWLAQNSDGPEAEYPTAEAAMCHATPSERATAFIFVNQEPRTKH